jgi:hypothetical protein
MGVSVAILAAAVGALGCADSGPRRNAISGNVTFAGKPLPAGMIFFDPDVRKKHDGPGGFAYIKDGAYDSRNNGKGVIAGPHVVRIQGFDGKPGNELPLGALLFPEYETTADLPAEASTRDFDVPASAAKSR